MKDKKVVQFYFLDEWYDMEWTCKSFILPLILMKPTKKKKSQKRPS